MTVSITLSIDFLGLRVSLNNYFKAFLDSLKYILKYVIMHFIFIFYCSVEATKNTEISIIIL